jgi:hypothetical protein
MILTDEVNIVRTNVLLANDEVMTDDEVVERVTVPAQVGFRGAQDEAGDGRLYYQAQALVVQIEPLPEDLNPTRHNIEWRGKRYALNGSPLIRRRQGEDHHWTVQLTRTSG